MMSDIQTPWTNMSAPKHPALSTLRVGRERSDSWYWIRCAGGLFGVAIQLPCGETEVAASIQGTAKINIVQVNDSNGDHYLGVVIGASELATVFHRLCLDLMSACSFSTSPAEIVAILKRRVLAWQRLFEKGYKKLSSEQCLGLIAELNFLQNNWIDGVSTCGVYGWVGPTMAPQDFRDEATGLAVEVKLHAFDTNIIKVSSREQLDVVDRLYLVAYPGAICTEDEGKTLNEYVEETRRVIPLDQYTVFDELLLSARYVKDPYYDEMHFQLGEPRAYRVEEGFPKLTGANLSPAICRVRYDLDLALVADWSCMISDIA